MPALDVPKMIRRVRQRLGLSQEGLARRLNATKGAVQHWERGRNLPDLARLFALRTLCVRSVERKDVDALIRQMQGRVGGLGASAPSDRKPVRGPGSRMAERENARLRQQVARLQGAIDRRSEQLRILEDVAADLQRQVAELKGGRAKAPDDVAGMRSS